MHPPRRLLAVLACAAASHAAWADRSKLDEEGAVERGDCELELQRERKTVRGEPSELGSSVQLGCGIGLRTELIVAVARQGSGSARDDSIDFELTPGWAASAGSAGHSNSAPAASARAADAGTWPSTRPHSWRHTHPARHGCSKPSSARCATASSAAARRCGSWRSSMRSSIRSSCAPPSRATTEGGGRSRRSNCTTRSGRPRARQSVLRGAQWRCT